MTYPVLIRHQIFVDIDRRHIAYWKSRENGISKASPHPQRAATHIYVSEVQSRQGAISHLRLLHGPKWLRVLAPPTGVIIWGAWDSLWANEIMDDEWVDVYEEVVSPEMPRLTKRRPSTPNRDHTLSIGGWWLQGILLGELMVICAWTNAGVNNRCGDLRRQRPHCDVVVMAN